MIKYWKHNDQGDPSQMGNPGEISSSSGAGGMLDMGQQRLRQDETLDPSSYNSCPPPGLCHDETGREGNEDIHPSFTASGSASTTAAAATVPPIPNGNVPFSKHPCSSHTHTQTHQEKPQLN